MIFHVDIARVDLQRAEGLAAVDIELTEKLQTLQTQVVHEAAEQVQTEVQRVKVMGASHSTLVPSRRKISCGRTAMTISRSPAGPPFLPALPCPRREMVCPLSMPAGMVTLSVLRRRSWPLP